MYYITLLNSVIRLTFFYCTARFTLTANALQLFTSKDSELIQRVHNLKKLTFIIYCGDVDHYKHYMPDIQGDDL